MLIPVVTALLFYYVRKSLQQETNVKRNYSANWNLLKTYYQNYFKIKDEKRKASEKIQWANNRRKESHTFYPIQAKELPTNEELLAHCWSPEVIEIDAYDSENQFVQKRGKWSL
jgi:hypothetical protein